MLISSQDYHTSLIHLHKAEAEHWRAQSRDGVARFPDYADNDNALLEHRGHPTALKYAEEGKSWLSHYTDIEQTHAIQWQSQFNVQPVWVLSSIPQMLEVDARMSLRHEEGFSPREMRAYKQIVQALYEQDGLQALAQKTRLPIDVVDLASRYYALEYARLKNVREAELTTHNMVMGMPIISASHAQLSVLCSICRDVIKGEPLSERLNREPDPKFWRRAKKLVAGTLALGALGGGWVQYEEQQRQTKLNDSFYKDASSVADGAVNHPSLIKADSAYWQGYVDNQPPVLNANYKQK